MGLAAQGSVGHRPGSKPFGYIFNGLHLVYRNGFAGLEAQKIANGSRRPIIHGLGKGLIVFFRTALDQFVHPFKHIRVEGVIFSRLAVTVNAFLVQSRFFLAERRLMKTQYISGDILQPDTVHP